MIIIIMIIIIMINYKITFSYMMTTSKIATFNITSFTTFF
jgi:hypothetical protein